MELNKLLCSHFAYAFYFKKSVFDVVRVGLRFNEVCKLYKRRAENEENFFFFLVACWGGGGGGGFFVTTV